MTILTDDDKIAIIDAVDWYNFPRDVIAETEKVIMAKLREQEPVAWMSPGKERLEFSRKDTVYGSHTLPLFRNPAPIPNSMTVLDLSDDDDLRFVQRVLESDAPHADRDAARELVVAIRTRIRKSAPIPEVWISVNDRLPEINTYVLVFSPVAGMYMNCFYDEGGYSGWRNIDPTHWMPLPKPPMAEARSGE